MAAPPWDQVAYDGDFCVVGSHHTGGGTEYAHVFERGGLPWTLIGILVAQDASAGQSFGWDVGIDGFQVLVAAPGDDEGANSAGAASSSNPISRNWRPRSVPCSPITKPTSRTAIR